MKTKDEVLQEIFDNDPMGILDQEFTTKDKLYMLAKPLMISLRLARTMHTL